MPKMMAVAVAWLREEDWPRWLTVDRSFHPSYDRWLKKTEAAVKEVEARGALVEKVTVNPDEFVEWCGVNGCEVEFQKQKRLRRAYLGPKT